MEEQVDRGTPWRIVAHNRAAWQEQAPDGYEAVVRATVAGLESFIVARVETSFSTDDPIVLLYVASAEPAQKRVVVSQQEHVIAIEILYVRKAGTAVGFSHGETSEARSKPA
jgi:hypothetical protein